MFDTSLGTVRVKVPQVVACLCEPEPIDEDCEIGKYRETLCPIENLLPKRLTPEVSYLCARAGAAQPYRGAADRVGEMCGLGQLSHMRVRRETMRIGEHIEEEQFRAGWFEGRRKHGGPRRFGLAIDSTVVCRPTFFRKRARSKSSLAGSTAMAGWDGGLPVLRIDEA